MGILTIKDKTHKYILKLHSTTINYKEFLITFGVTSDVLNKKQLYSSATRMLAVLITIHYELSRTPLTVLHTTHYELRCTPIRELHTTHYELSRTPIKELHTTHYGLSCTPHNKLRVIAYYPQRNSREAAVPGLEQGPLRRGKRLLLVSIIIIPIEGNWVISQQGCIVSNVFSPTLASLNGS